TRSKRDWSSDVCSSDLRSRVSRRRAAERPGRGSRARARRWRSSANITRIVSPRTHRIPSPPPGGLDASNIVDAFAHHMMYSVAKDHFTATDFDVYQALAYAVRDRPMERWFRPQS